jgi:hypothetical protein
VKANITDDIDPELTADARVIYDAGTTKDEAGFLADVHATLSKVGTITSNFKDVVDLNKVGAYVVTMQGTDEFGKETNIVQTIVLVKDENTIIDETNNTMITAYDFSLNLTAVPAADFVAAAKAEAWDMRTGAAVAVTYNGEKPETGGVHEVVFNAGKTTKHVKLTIVDDVELELTADARIVYDAGVRKTAEAFLADVYALLNKPGTITSNFKDVVDLNKVGAYVVTVQGTDTAGNASNSVRVIVLIKDEYTIIDDVNDTMITAHDFEVRLSDVQGADFVLKAKAQAWDISNGQAMEVQLDSAKPTAYGAHQVTFIAGSSSRTVNVTIPNETIIVEADNIHFLITEFNQLKANKSLEAEVLNRSNAQAYIKVTGEQLRPLTADVSALLTIDVTGGEVFDVAISYEAPRLFAQTSGEGHSKQTVIIQVTIDNVASTPTPKPTPKPTPIPGLPITGENITLLVVGLMTFISSLFILFFIILYRRRKEKETEPYRLTKDE